jgi:hypothetical protein
MKNLTRRCQCLSCLCRRRCGRTFRQVPTATHTWLGGWARRRWAWTGGWGGGWWGGGSWVVARATKHNAQYSWSSNCFFEFRASISELFEQRACFFHTFLPFFLETTEVKLGSFCAEMVPRSSRRPLFGAPISRKFELRNSAACIALKMQM